MGVREARRFFAGLVMMIRLPELGTAGVTVTAVAQGQRRIKFVGFGDVFGRLEKVSFRNKLEGLRRAVGSLRFNRHVCRGRQPLACRGAQAEDRRHSLLKNAQFDFAVTRIQQE